MKGYVLPAVLSTIVLMGGCASTGSGGHAGSAADDHAAHAASDAHAGHGAAEHAGHDFPATDGPGFRVADVQFMQHMIGHHAQATIMAALASTNGAGHEVTLLAQKIDISQEDEMLFMERWLSDRDQYVPPRDHPHDPDMPGMVSEENMARLAAARGRDFDLLFLEFMIEHHIGAIVMVDDLFASPGAGQDPDIFRFATDVAADQNDEIGVMEGLLQRFSEDATN